MKNLIIFCLMFNFFASSQNINQENLKSLYDFKAELINGDTLDFSVFNENVLRQVRKKGNKLGIVRICKNQWSGQGEDRADQRDRQYMTTVLVCERCPRHQDGPQLTTSSTMAPAMGARSSITSTCLG